MVPGFSFILFVYSRLTLLTLIIKLCIILYWKHLFPFWVSVIILC